MLAVRSNGRVVRAQAATQAAQQGELLLQSQAAEAKVLSLRNNSTGASPSQSSQQVYEDEEGSGGGEAEMSPRRAAVTELVRTASPGTIVALQVRLSPPPIVIMRLVFSPSQAQWYRKLAVARTLQSFPQKLHGGASSFLGRV